MYCTHIFYVCSLERNVCLRFKELPEAHTRLYRYVVDQLNLRYIGISAAYRKRILPDNRRRRRSYKEEYEKVIYLPPIASYHMPIDTTTCVCVCVSVCELQFTDEHSSENIIYPLCFS